MKRLHKIILPALIASLAMANAFAAKQKTIKLGFNIPLTGDSPKVGESAKFAGEIIKSEINSAGGLDVKGLVSTAAFIQTAQLKKQIFVHFAQ